MLLRGLFLCMLTVGVVVNASAAVEMGAELSSLVTATGQVDSGDASSFGGAVAAVFPETGEVVVGTTGDRRLLAAAGTWMCFGQNAQRQGRATGNTVVDMTTVLLSRGGRTRRVMVSTAPPRSAPTD